MHLPTLLKNKEKSQRSRQMSSSKTIGIIGGGQLGQMMAISAIYMGHKVIALDP
ncbi:5-(carboxyamino)imidazole ribonucleotide synthase, partial [Streptococcus pneumoniae]|nr:5-(carboxyamino)imidazole ribonucleotide synthase [Streptococcus pneumoniae]